MNIHFGDLSTSQWILEKSEFDTVEETIIQKQELLQHAFKYVLKFDPVLIRTPSEKSFKYYLEKVGLADKAEAIFTAPVEAAQQLMEKLESQTSLAGTIGSLPSDLDVQIKKEEYSEAAVFLADKGIDTYFLTHFKNIEEVKLAGEIALRVHDAPLIVFFEFKNDVGFINSIRSDSIEMGLQMVGFNISLKDYLDFDFTTFTQIPWGIEISFDETPTEIELNQFNQKIKKENPHLVLGGVGVQESIWEKILTVSE